MRVASSWKTKQLRGIKRGKIADERNVGTSTVSDCVKSKENLVKYTKKQGNGSSYKYKIINIRVYEAVNEELFLWFTQQSEKGIPISGLILKVKPLI